MTPSADLPFTPRERLRWQRAKDARLADAIFGCVLRDPVGAERAAAIAPKPAMMPIACAGTIAPR